MLILAFTASNFFWSSNKSANQISTQPTTWNTTPTEQQNLESKTIYALWDSLTAWYQLPLEEWYPAQLEDALWGKWFTYTVINWWKSWDTSAWLLSRLQRLLQDSKPQDIAIVVIGANDGLQSLSIEQLSNNITKIIEFLQEKELTIILWGMQLPTNLDPVYRQQFAQIYPDIAKQYSLPLIPFFLEWVAADPTLNLRDWIHPNKEWYEIIAQQTLRFMEDQWLLQK